MIPVADQNRIRERFSRDLKSRLRIDYFTQRPSPIFVPGRECVHCADIQEMLEDLAALSPRIHLTVHEFDAQDKTTVALGVDKVPAIVLRGQTNRPLRIFGMTSGTLFPGFLDTLVETARGTVDLQPETVKTLRKLRNDVRVQVLVSPACPYSPAMARTALKFALQSVRVKVDVVEVSEFPALLQQVGVPAVPVTILNNEYATPGVIDEADLARAVLLAVEGKEVSVVSRPGTVTPLGQPSQQAAPRTSPSGLYIPRG